MRDFLFRMKGLNIKLMKNQDPDIIMTYIKICGIKEPIILNLLVLNEKKVKLTNYFLLN